MFRIRKLAVLAAPALLLGACAYTVVDPNRVTLGEEGVDPEAVMVRPEYSDPFERCANGGEVAIFVEGEGPVATGTAGANGLFEIPITPPAALGTFAVEARCERALAVVGADDAIGAAQQAVLDLTLIADQLVVVPALVLEADPTVLAPQETFEVTGNFCVSQWELGADPVVTVVFEGESQVVEADQSQPFEDTWTVEFDAPAEAGTYPVTATCVYDETEPPRMILLAEGGAVPAEDHDDEPEWSEPQEYPPAEVEVVVDVPEVPEVPEEPPTTPEEPGPTTGPAETARTPAAQPVVAAPTFTA